MRVDWLIVGAGYSACVLGERIATQLGQRVLIVERRDRICGNAYDYYNEHGILVHKYSPHIFHTKSKKVWDYLSQFTEWRPYYQEVGTVNYPNEYDITRITDQKYLSGQTLPKTTLVMEYPQPYVPGKNDPYYPIPREENRERYDLYLKECQKLNGTVIFAGRLAEYKYYDMDQAALRVLSLFEKEVVQ